MIYYAAGFVNRWDSAERTRIKGVFDCRRRCGIMLCMVDNFDIGDHIVMKKPHACGTNEWVVTRTGADVKLRCVSCGRLIMLDRLDFLKNAKKNLGEGAEKND